MMFYMNENYFSLVDGKWHNYNTYLIIGVKCFFSKIIGISYRYLHYCISVRPLEPFIHNRDSGSSDLQFSELFHFVTKDSRSVSVDPCYSFLFCCECCEFSLFSVEESPYYGIVCIHCQVDHSNLVMWLVHTILASFPLTVSIIITEMGCKTHLQMFPSITIVPTMTCFHKSLFYC